MKSKYLLLLFIIFIGYINNNQAQNWLKITNDGYKEYNNKNYCKAFDYFNQVNSSDEEDAKIAIKIWGVEQFNKLLHSSNELCIKEKLLNIDKELIEYSLDWKTNKKPNYLDVKIKNILNNSVNVKFDVDFYKGILDRIYSKNHEIYQNYKSTIKTIKNNKKTNTLKQKKYQNKFYYSLIVNLILSIVLLIILYKWIIKKYSII